MNLRRRGAQAVLALPLCGPVDVALTFNVRALTAPPASAGPGSVWCWLALVLTVQCSIAQCAGTHSLPRAPQLDPCSEWTEDEARGIGLSIDEVGTRGLCHVLGETRSLASLAVVTMRPSF